MKERGNKLITNKKALVGVKVISVLYFIVATFFLVVGGVSIFYEIPDLYVVGGAIVFAPVMFGLAVLFFFIGRGLWKLQSWARTTTIAISSLGIILSLYNLILYYRILAIIYTDLISLIINVPIALYLLFNKKVKAVFA